MHDEAVSIGQFCCSDDFLVGGIQTTVADVFHDGTGEEVGVLQYHRHGAAQIILTDFLDVDAIVADLTGIQLVEAVEQVGDGGFACTGGADEGDLLTRFCVKTQIVENRLVRHIAEGHIFEHNVALHFGVGESAVMMRMFPCPDAGTLVGFDQIAVFVLLSIDQSDIAVVLFFWGVNESEDALCTG